MSKLKINQEEKDQIILPLNPKEEKITSVIKTSKGTFIPKLK